MKSPERAPEPPDTRGLIEALKSPRAYEYQVDEVGFLQTHISLLFFAGDRVYKVKKPVDLGFLDFTELERRRHFCQEEVRLNRRLAPEVYLGVVPIAREHDGSLRVGGSGEVVDWAVEMVRLPEESMLANLLERGVVDNQEIRKLVALLVRFHADASTGEGVNEHGDPSAIAYNVEENWNQLEPFVTKPSSSDRIAVFSQCQLDFLRDRAGAFLSDQHTLFVRRVEEGRIREGHGDLHAGNVCFTEGEVVAYDCIEFNRRFRCGDVAADLAFLAMDLDFRGYPGFSRYLVKNYASSAQDRELEALMPFYKGYRAVVRGKVTAMNAAAADSSEERREKLRREAMRYLHLAAGYELPPTLILMCGLPASGKSWLARYLTRPLRASLIQSDVRRGVQARVRPQALDPYSPENMKRTYRSLQGDVVGKLRSGYPLIVDASFSKAIYRRPFVDLATRLGLPFLIVHVEAPDEVIRERIAEQATLSADAPPISLEVYERERATFERPTEVPSGHVLKLASEKTPPEDLGSAIIDHLIRRTRKEAETRS